VGIDFHTLNFLRHVAGTKPFGETATIARQEVHVNPLVLGRALPLRPDYVHEAYCESLLTGYFGATRVDSIDNSDFENATIIHDMNQPLPPEHQGRYDTVLDLGCIEHVYNAPQALWNASALLRPGGQVIHVLPANNYCGHGFWQFSPELFFSLYAGANGYAETEVFLADYPDKWRWWKVAAPQGGQRVNVLSTSEVYVMVRSVRAGDTFSHDRVQQSDYAFEWSNTVHDPQPMAVPGGIKGAMMRLPGLYDRLFPLFHRAARLKPAMRLSDANPGLSEVDVHAV